MAKLKGNKKFKKQLLLANEALYPSSADKKDWIKEIDLGPQDPEPGEAVFGIDSKGQHYFEFLKALQINKKRNKKLAMAPRLIKGGVVPNAIIKAPHIDSRYIDKLLIRRKKNQGGVQLPSFL
tara:strand:+ start:163 stop:531 length:369 start_codon:yes stop_codon:yes gene_type:complete